MDPSSTLSRKESKKRVDVPEPKRMKSISRLLPEKGKQGGGRTKLRAIHVIHHTRQDLWKKRNDAGRMFLDLDGPKRKNF